VLLLQILRYAGHASAIGGAGGGWMPDG